jgi:cell division protein FtsW
MSYRKGEIDYIILITMLLLAGFGFVMSYSVSDYLISGNSSLFRARDIKHPEALAQKISKAQDPVAAYLKQRFSQTAIYHINHFRAISTDSLRSVIAGQLNGIIQGQSIYDSLRFKEVALSRAAVKLVSGELQADEQTRFNRLLLQDAFPDEIRKSKLFYYRLGILKNVLIRYLIATGAFLLAFKVNYRKLRKIIGPAFVIMLAILVITPFATQAVRGARSWFLGVQPAEFAKLALVLFLADFMARRGEQMKSLKRGFIPAFAFVLLVCGAVAVQPDFGSALVIGMLGYLMLYVGGVNMAAWSTVLAGGMAGFIGLALRYSHIKSRLAGYWLAASGSDDLSRIFQLNGQELQQAVLSKYQQVMSHAPSSGELVGFKNSLSQTYQSLLGIGSGGILGVGLGQSRQKLLFLPEAHTDFIYSIIAEEGGLIIAGAVLFLFWVLLWRGIRMSGRMPEAFDSYAVTGISLAVFLQAAVNISVALGLFPITGIPLPFLSFGGSALLVNAAALGLLLNMSQYRATSPGGAYEWRKDEAFDSRRRNRRASLSRAGGSL